jgi:hypothetical protein
MIVAKVSAASAQDSIRPKGMELFEITPVILGGDPVDPNNKTWLTRQQHFEAVRYWNRVIRGLMPADGWSSSA